MICSLRDVQYTYPGQSSPSIQDICLDIKQGEFVLIIGESGSGKSTLIRTLNRIIPDFYGGSIRGDIQVQGRAVRDWDHGRLAAEIGFVFQDPERQMVMTEVEQELAFGLENIGVQADQIKRRVNEVVSYFNLADLRHRTTASLSGGEKQRVAIASVMALQPNILILDEPTSQLDPTAAEEVLNLIDLLHRDLGLTILMVEQRLDRCLHVADRVVVMNDGRIEFAGSVDAYSEWAAKGKCTLIPYVAKPFLEFATAFGTDNDRIPINVQQAREHIHELVSRKPVIDTRQMRTGEQANAIGKSGAPVLAKSLTPSSSPSYNDHQDSSDRRHSWWKRSNKWFGNRGKHTNEDAPLLQIQNIATAIQTRNVSSATTYTVNQPLRSMILHDLWLEIRKGEIVSVIGPNGAGKSTLLRSIVCLQPLLKGAVKIQGIPNTQLVPEDMAGLVGYLSQNPGDYLFQETLWDECMFSLDTALPYHRKRGSRSWSKEDVQDLLERLQIWKYKDQNPRDLSGGERQRAAIAAVWVQNPVLLLLDEPTRGMDQQMKQVLGDMIVSFASEGRSVILVTHDLDFAANISDRIAFLMDGTLIAEGPPDRVLSQGMFYTTHVHRAFRQWNTNIVTQAQAHEFLLHVEETL